MTAVARFYTVEHMTTTSAQLKLVSVERKAGGMFAYTIRRCNRYTGNVERVVTITDAEGIKAVLACFDKGECVA